jgi:hypothetical protein
MTNPPHWSNEVINKSRRRDMSYMCQGTVALKYSDLGIPTIHGLEDGKRILVIVVLAKKALLFPEEHMQNIPA